MNISNDKPRCQFAWREPQPAGGGAGGLRVMALVLVVARLAAGQAGKGTVAGKVVGGKTGAPVAVALVTLMRSGLPPLAKSTKTGADGAFEVQGLAAGRYRVCVQGGEGYLDPCQWGGALEVAVEETGGAVGGVDVRLAEAVVVRVELVDGQDLMRQVGRSGRRPGVTVGVWGPNGLSEPARASGSRLATGDGQGAGWVHANEAGVAGGTALWLQVGSAELRLGDAGGAALAGNGRRQEFRTEAAGAKAKVFTFTVLGALP